LGELQSWLSEGIIKHMFNEVMFGVSTQTGAQLLVSEKSEKQQQDKSEAHLEMQADVSNVRNQYAIGGGGAA
jgi:hypothetical protein